MEGIIGILFIVIIVAGAMLGKDNNSCNTQRKRPRERDNGRKYPPSYY